MHHDEIRRIAYKIFCLAELCVYQQHLLISWMKKLKFSNSFIINQSLSNFFSQ